MASTVRPSEAGFHCSVSCWRKAGGAEALVAALEAKSESLRDWFVLAEWATAEQLATHVLPPMAEVHAIQPFLNLEQVDAYCRGAVSANDKKFYETYPTLFRFQGKMFIFQGTHRLAAAYSEEAATYEGWFLDVDSLTQ